MLNARMPPRVEQKLAEYCAKHGLTRTEVTVRALDAYLEREAGPGDAYALAADLIPKRGAPRLQSRDARKLVRSAVRGPRAR
jgi:hypothetical protein